MGIIIVKEISIDRIKESFVFNKESGVLSWVINPKKKIKNQYAAGYVDSYGYLVIKLDKQLFKAHRLIWALHYGKFPISQIDHINGIKTDNRISNLREATQSENNMNRRKAKNNTSGVKGVYLSPNNKWRSRIKVNGKIQSVGTFDRYEDAVAARLSAEKTMHGDFAVPQCVVKAWESLS